MSADDYTDCPSCKHNHCVAMYGVNDYKINEDGTTENTNLRGSCDLCGKGFGKYKGQTFKVDERHKRNHKCERENCEERK